MFYERNKVLTMLEQKKIPLGIQCFTGNTALVEVMGATGFDFVMFDCVHSGNDVRAMEELVRTATLAGMASYIRVPDAHNETDVRRALEAGSEGLVLREVHSVDDIKAAANAASVPAGFTPEGLPVGLQIVGRNKADVSVLEMAYAFEQATGFGKRRPAVA